MTSPVATELTQICRQNCHHTVEPLASVEKDAKIVGLAEERSGTPEVNFSPHQHADEREPLRAGYPLYRTAALAFARRSTSSRRLLIICGNELFTR